MTTHTDNYPKSLHHVHVRLARPAELPNLNAGRYILTCASRYAADDFFRATASLYGLTRLSPQLWTYTVGGETGLHNIQKDPNVPFDVKAPVLINWLANGDIRVALSIGVPATGRDWISGHCYYIRNMREKDCYWYVGSGGQVMASRRRKTRFLVEVVRPARAAEQGPVYLVRADRIRISTQEAGGRGEVVRRGGGGRVVCVVAGDIQERGEGEFVFGDLLGGFSTGWASEEEDAVEHVTWVESGVYGDDWELC